MWADRLNELAGIEGSHQILHKLEELGWVTHEWCPGSGNRKRKLFSFTDGGFEYANKLLAERSAYLEWSESITAKT